MTGDVGMWPEVGQPTAALTGLSRLVSGGQVSDGRGWSSTSDTATRRSSTDYHPSPSTQPGWRGEELP